MTKEDIIELIEKYGIEWILDDCELSQAQALEILDELGFIDLGKYSSDD